MSFTLHHGDSLEILATMPDASVDSMVTDPPAGISFMGKTWDHDHGGREGWCNAFSAIFSEALRVLKPGSHALVWAIPRTSHWTATALEDAGFEIRDVVVHLFGTGFPKSLDVSKAIDKAAGAEREIVGPKMRPDGKTMAEARPSWVGKENEAYDRPWKHDPVAVERQASITAPATDLARQWQGWGTALKPAAEHWILCRKPLIGTVAANVTEHGTGALNVDGCRIGGDVDTRRPQAAFCHTGTETGTETGGRWPANVTLSHDPECSDQCVQGCAVRALDEQSGESVAGSPRGDRGSGGIWANGNGVPCGPQYGDTGTASRFFYCAKPSSAERNTGWVRNQHPTVKPAELMQYFCRLVTPPGGVVLDPFCGSGSTGIGALREGFSFVGIEREEEYVNIARERLIGDAPLLNQEEQP